ncbi:GspMb/PilO family protein [Methylobacterium sp. Leaf118]|uniref:GspMb/PilO family protein n=1 Tax=Methylobacterium sp. Leaf118 TaxID=2876562 RepID=UPI001E515DAE|nr:GspMb/PilO family protein [Methylobacterium sp. Leaf118]
MRALLSDGRARPILLGLFGSGLALVLILDHAGAAFDASARIDTARERLARLHRMAARPPLPPVLTAPDADGLLAAFRGRLDALAGGRAVVLDRSELERDPDHPDRPRLRAVIRGTAAGLHGLLHALETEAPILAIEEADLDVERAADPETGRPTVMRAALTARGLVLPPVGPEAQP